MIYGNIDSLSCQLQANLVFICENDTLKTPHTHRLLFYFLASLKLLIFAHEQTVRFFTEAYKTA